jgi:hypothetical protein
VYEALAVVVLASAVGASAPAPLAPVEERPDVEVTLVGDVHTSTATRVVLEELLGTGFDVDYAASEDVSLETIVTPRRTEREVVARVWVELTGQERATIYLVDGAWERILIRHVPTPDGYGEIQREQVGHIVSASVEALAGGATIGVHREEVARELGVAPEPEPEPPPAVPPTVEPEPTQPPPQEVSAWLSASYDLSVFADQPVVTHGPTAAAVFELSPPSIRPGFGVSLHYGLPVRVQTEEIALRLDTLGLRGRLGLGPPVSPKVSLRPWVAGGVDMVLVEPRALRGGVEPFERFWTPVPIIELGFGVGVRIGRGAELRAALFGEFDPVDTTYEFADSRTPIFDPWVARVGARVGLALDPLAIRRSR